MSNKFSYLTLEHSIYSTSPSLQFIDMEFLLLNDIEFILFAHCALQLSVIYDSCIHFFRIGKKINNSFWYLGHNIIYLLRTQYAIKTICKYAQKLLLLTLILNEIFLQRLFTTYKFSKVKLRQISSDNVPETNINCLIITIYNV